MITTLLWLLFAHALCDYPLQGPFLSQAKVPGGVPGFPWYQALGAHAMIHAGAVALITGSWWLAGAEFAAHWVIDYLKGRRVLSVNQDQLAHIACKVLWAAIAVGVTL